MPILWWPNVFQNTDSRDKNKGTMKYSVTIEITDQRIQKLLAVEYRDLKKKRFTTSMKDGNIIIKAADGKALKAIMFSVVHTIETFEKMEEIALK